MFLILKNKAKTMLVDLWGWFNNYHQEAVEKGDVVRQRLAKLAYEGWEYRRLAQAEKAIRAFEEGRSLAKGLDEPCWEVFHEMWVAVIHLFVQYDYQKAQDMLVRLVAEVRKDKYRYCLIKGQIIFLLAKIYSLLDLGAYESEIVKLLDYLEAEVGMDRDTYLQLLATRAEIEMYHKRYEAARDRSQELINQSEGMDFRLYDGYRLLRRIAFAQGELVSALEYNRVAQKHSIAMNIQDCIADEKLWEAVLLKYSGDDSSAREKYYAALAHYQQYNLPREGDYRVANTEYLELDKRFDEAIALAESVLAVLNNQASLSYQIDAYCVYIALLGRCGKDFSEPLAKAKDIAKRSGNPEPLLSRLAWIEAGNYFEYEWQKGSIKGKKSGSG
jgi:hypothetical protein